jgi:integrase
MTRHVTTAAKVEEYLAFRRGLGFRLKVEGGMLRQFARFADDARHHGPLTTELALRWATATTSADRLYGARRLEVVRCFARHLAATEPGTEIPPRGLLGRAHRRNTPHIYTDDEVARLMVAAGQLDSPGGLRSHTYRTLIGLLAAAGLRISEAMHLDRADVDLDQDRLVIRQTKFRKTRLVPVHPTTTSALREYAEVRDRAIPNPTCDRFFVSHRGTRLTISTVDHTFRKVCDRVVISRAARRPRLYDLRHTFACRRVETWYDAGIDLAKAVAALSVYLGHGKVTDTYWYLTATPDLLARAAARFEGFAQSVDGEVKP